MFSWKARPRLEAFVATLRSWEADVPPRATSFHNARTSLATQIQAAMPRFWQLTFSDDDMQRYDERVRRLTAIAQPLAELIDQTGTLATEVTELAELANDLDSTMASWLRERCDDWLAHLERLGANTEWQTDLVLNRAELARIEADVREHAKALRELRDAEQLLTEVSGDARRNDLRASALRGSLSDFRERLRANGPSREWSSDLGSLVDPLRAFVDVVKDPPAELHTAAKILTDARGWSTLLGKFADEVQRLEERRFKPLDWSAKEIEDLVNDATALRTQLVHEAHQARMDKLEDLEQQMNDLLQACGPQPVLEPQLAELREIQTSRPQWFGGWLSKAAQFQNSFNAIAYTHVGRLEDRLKEHVEKLQGALDELEKRPLSEDVAKKVTLLRRAVRELPATFQSDRILIRLRHANALTRELEDLERRAKDEFEAFERSEAALLARAQELDAAMRRVKRANVSISDLVWRMSRMQRDTEGGTLAERQQVVAGFSERLDASEATFVENCRHELAKQTGLIERAVRVVRDAGSALPPFSLPAIAADAGARAAADAMVDAVHTLREINQQVRKLVETLDTRAAKLRMDLGELSDDDLVPADRDTAARLQRALDSVLHVENKGALFRLEPLAKHVQDGERFFMRLLQDERDARARLAELRERLQRFREEQLERHYPELTDRVSALIEGVPPDPRHWSAVQYQLTIASDLLRRLELHAARLEAADLQKAEGALKSALRTGDPALRATAQAALAELDAAGTEALPPFDVRHRVHEAYRRSLRGG